MKIFSLESLRLGTIALVFFTGCLFDSNDQVAGGEDFPNTITPLGKVAANDISSDTNWDQFNGIDTTPNLAVDSLTASVSAVAKLAVTAASTVQDSIYTKQSLIGGVSIIQHVEVNGGSDGNLSTKSDNRVEEYDLLRSRSGDTLEWTQLLGAVKDSALWGKGDSGTVILQHQIETPSAKPQVRRVWSTLKARIYNFGKTSTVLSYTERSAWLNGDTTVFTVKGIRSVNDSLLIPNDTSYVTYDRTSSQTSQKNGAPATSKGSFRVHLGKLLGRSFSDNALVHFEIVNRWNAGIIRYDSIAFVPDSPVVSGKHAMRGTFTVSTLDSTSAKGQLKGIFRNDSIQVNMQETRNGKIRNYYMVYDNDGNVKAKDTLPDADSIAYPANDNDADDLPAIWKPDRK